MKSQSIKNALVLFAYAAAAVFVISGIFHPVESFGAILGTAPFMARQGAQRVIATQDKARVTLEEFRSKMRGNDIVITPGYLGDDVLLSNGTAIGTIPFNLTQIQTGNTATSVAQRLKNNDAFIVTDIGIYIGTAVAVAGVSTPLQQASIRLETFPNSLVVTAGEAVSLNAIYNGWLSIKEASTTYFEQISAMRYRRVGMAQRGTLLYTASNQLESTWDSPYYGMAPITPQFQMAGNKGYAFNLNLPAAITIPQSTILNIYASIRLAGYLATGGAPYVQ